MRKIDLMKIYFPYIKKYSEKERYEDGDAPIELVPNAPKEAVDALKEIEKRTAEEAKIGIITN